MKTCKLRDKWISTLIKNNLSNVSFETMPKKTKFTNSLEYNESDFPILNDLTKNTDSY